MTAGLGGRRERTRSSQTLATDGRWTGGRGIEQNKSKRPQIRSGGGGDKIKNKNIVKNGAASSSSQCRSGGLRRRKCHGQEATGARYRKEIPVLFGFRRPLRRKGRGPEHVSLPSLLFTPLRDVPRLPTVSNLVSENRLRTASGDVITTTITAAEGFTPISHHERSHTVFADCVPRPDQVLVVRQ